MLIIGFIERDKDQIAHTRDCCNLAIGEWQCFSCTCQSSSFHGVPMSGAFIIGQDRY